MSWLATTTTMPTTTTDGDAATAKAAPCGYRTRGDIPWDVKVKHHGYLVPLALAALFAFFALKSK